MSKKLRKPLSWLLALCMIMSLLPMSVFAEPSTDPLQPATQYYTFDGNSASQSNADITLSKTAVENADGTYTVTLSATANEVVTAKPTEVVFVIDGSGSMNFCTENLELHRHEWIGIGLVGYYACHWNGTTCDYLKAHDHAHTWNKNNVACCTKVQSGEAESRWEIALDAIATMQESLGSAGIQYHYVVYDDDAYVYDGENAWERLQDFSPSKGTNISEGVKEAVDCFELDGANQVMIIVADGETDNNRYPTQTANSFKRDGGEIYTVGFTFSNEDFHGLSSGTDYQYNAANAEELELTMESIGENIQGLITDPLGPDVELVGDVSVTGSNYQAWVTGGDTINWTDPNGLNGTVTLTYTVKLDESKIQAGSNSFELNGDATLNYSTTANGYHEVAFPQPVAKFDAATLSVSYQDESGATVAVQNPIAGEWVKVKDGAAFEAQIPTEGSEIQGTNGTTYYVTNVTGAPTSPLTAKEYTVVVTLSNQPPVPTYTLTYDANGGTGGPGTVPGLEAQEDYHLNTTNTPTHADVGGTAVVFIGWTAEKDAKIYAKNDNAPATITTVDIEGNTEVYAVWGYDTNTEYNPAPDVTEDKYTVTYQWSGLPEESLASLPTGITGLIEGDTYTVDSTYTSTSTVTDSEGNEYTFSGWKLGSAVVTGQQTIGAESVTLTGTWTKTGVPVTPVEPVVAAYKVEHYWVKGGVATLHETETLYGNIESTVTAQTKTYPNYEYDPNYVGTVPSGQVTMPTMGVDGQPVILTLKLYYTYVPSAPDEDDLPGILGNTAVQVTCTNSDVNHSSATYGVLTGGCEVGTVQGNKDTGYTCTVTVNSSPYVAQYNTVTYPGTEHGLATGEAATKTITLTWNDIEEKWVATTTLPVNFNVVCVTNTLTYNANGGTFTTGTTFTVSGLEDNDAYVLGEEAGYTQPTKGTDVFLGWTTDATASGKVYGAGQQLPTVVTQVKIPETTTVYAVWGADTNGDGIADAQQVVITPADIVVYTGGVGYDGVVATEGGATVGSNGIPEPGYYFILPYALNEKLQSAGGGYVDLSGYIRLDDMNSETRQWVLEFYDGTTNSEDSKGHIYRLVEVSEDGQNGTPAKLVIKDSDGNIVTNDQLTISNDALYQDYTMSLDDSAVNQIAVEVKIDDEWVDVNTQYGEGTVAGLILEEGKLTVRGEDTTTPTVTTDVVTYTSDISDTNADIVAVASTETNYNINSSNISVTNGNIALFTDGLLPNDVLNDYLVKQNLIGESAKVIYQYLDLVDTNNGNAYVTTEDLLDIYWKLPDDADPDGTFYVVHFNGLDRNYDVDDLESLIGDSNHSVTIYSKANGNLEIVTIDDEQYLKFATSTFSPFALVYDAKYTITANAGAGGSISPSGSVTVAYGGNQKFTITANSGYHIEDVTVDGKSVGAVSSFTFSDVQANHTIVATFDKDSSGTVTPDEYTLRYDTNGGNEIDSESEKKPWTKEYEDLPTPVRSGYIFEGWYRNSTLTMRVTEDVYVNSGTVTLYAKWSEKPGPDDTGVSDWLETEEHNAYLTGYPDSTFRADRNMTRAEVAQMFYALLLDKDVTITKSFSDVPDDAWYATAVKTLASLGMMDGYPDGTFRPDEPITRAEFATVGLAFAYDAIDADCSYYDVSTSAWYYTYVAQATTYGWIGGYPDNTFRPSNNITRVEVCVIVNNMLGRSADERYIDRNEDELVHFMDLSDSYWGYYTIMEATNSHEYTGNYTNETWKSVK